MDLRYGSIFKVKPISPSAHRFNWRNWIIPFRTMYKVQDVGTTSWVAASYISMVGWMCL